MTPAADGKREFVFDVFFSYDTKDEPRVRAIRDEFKRAGLRTYFAADDLKSEVGNRTWANTMLEALPKSCHLVVYVSTNALTSEWVRREVTGFTADVEAMPPGSAERRILLLRGEDMDEAEMPKRLQ